jgi:hypothetical protein
MAPRTLSAQAKLLAALGVTSLALMVAAPASNANQASTDADGTLALVNPQGESTYKTGAAEAYGNVVDGRGYKSAASEGWGNVVADRG